MPDSIVSGPKRVEIALAQAFFIAAGSLLIVSQGFKGGRACCIVACNCSDWTTSAMVMLLTSRCDEAIGDENHLASIMVLIIKLGSESGSHASLIQSKKVASGYSWWWWES